MKKSFTLDTINNGCYGREKAATYFAKKKTLTITHILNLDIPLKHKFWFVRNNCDLDLKQKQILALNCARIVMPIYNKKYPNDTRITECIDATGKFLNGEISRDELITKRNAADAAAADAAAYVAYAAAYAAYAAAYDAADAYAKSTDDYSGQLLTMLKKYCKSIK